MGISYHITVIKTHLSAFTNAMAMGYNLCTKKKKVLFKVAFKGYFLLFTLHFPPVLFFFLMVG